MPSLPVDTLKQIGNIWRRLSAPGRIAVAATMLLAFGGLLVVMFWARTPSFVVLESGLDLARSSKITELLDAQGIEFRTSNASTTILVPAQDVSRARLKLAGQNLITSPGAVVDEKVSPWDDKDARLARQNRRLQVELSRVIAGFEGIEAATVTIAAGRDSPFERLQRPPTASVHVRSDAGRTIGPQQVQGIVRTVASAVPGLTEENVYVIGADGRPLTSPRNGADLLGGGDSMAYRTAVEAELEENLRVILDRMVGPGHHSESVVVDMNFDATTTTRTTYDGEGKVLLEKTSDKTTTPQISAGGAPDAESPGSAGALPTSKSENKVEKWMVPEVTTTEIRKTPEIKRISAGITVDQKVFTGDVAELQEVLAQALGIDAARGDKLIVTVAPFAEIEFPEIVAESKGFAMDGLLDVLQYVVAGLVGLGLLMFFRSVLRTRPGTTVPAKIGTQLDLTVDDDDDLPEEKVSPKVLQRRKLKKEIARAIDQDPRGVAKLVEMWLEEEGA